jgi:hypothetical protein
MLEHESHIRIDAKRRALDTLDAKGGRVWSATDSGNVPQNAEIDAIIDVPERIASQSRHSLRLSAKRAARKKGRAWLNGEPTVVNTGDRACS